jgi:hypothetical protein
MEMIQQASEFDPRPSRKPMLKGPLAAFKLGQAKPYANRNRSGPREALEDMAKVWWTHLGVNLVYVSAHKYVIC